MDDDLQQEFLSSFRALLTRYNVEIEKAFVGFDDEVENTFVFQNMPETKDGTGLIYFELGQHLEYLNAR